MKITFGGFFRITPATIMRCGPTFRLARTRPTHARSSGLETSLRSRSLADYTIDTHESEFSEATSLARLRAGLVRANLLRGWRSILNLTAGNINHELGKLGGIAGTFSEGHDRSSPFTARMRSRAIHPASEAASGVEYDSAVLSAQLGSSVRVMT